MIIFKYYQYNNIIICKIWESYVIVEVAIITKSFKENDILIGGVPAKIIKRLGKYEEKTEL